jgi:SAM-dependent methyltransferase
MIGKASLALPQVYQTFQELGGFFGARVKAIGAYLPLKPGARVIDIGCGPGHIAARLPESIDYVGFDTDADYIAFARRTFAGPRRAFHCTPFDAARAQALAPADAVMMNGVLHHMNDGEARATLGAIAAVLAQDGVLFTLDGAYRPGQSALAKWLLDNDRGAYVRPAEAYAALIESALGRVDLHVRDDLSRVPYTYAICVARKG